MSDARFALSVVIWFCSAIGIIAWVWWSRQGVWPWEFAVAPIMWLVNVSLFYTVILIINQPPSEFFSLWSAVIRLQAIITIIAGGIIFLDGRRRKRG